MKLKFPPQSAFTSLNDGLYKPILEAEYLMLSDSLNDKTLRIWKEYSLQMLKAEKIDRHLITDYTLFVINTEKSPLPLKEKLYRYIVFLRKISVRTYCFNNELK